LATPSGVAVDGAGNLWVGDTVNNRVLRYSVPISSGMSATLALGQANLSNHAVNRGGPVAANTLGQPFRPRVRRRRGAVGRRRVGIIARCASCPRSRPG